MLKREYFMMAGDLMESLEKFLKKDLTEGGITKRDPDKVKQLEQKCDDLRTFFAEQGADVTVELTLNSGFNSLAFISVQGKSIHMFDKRIVDSIREGASYANIILADPGKIVFELGYTGLV